MTTTLTQEEKRELIAKASGWILERGGWWSNPSLPDWPDSTEPPDYFGDLNACHEMEKALDIESHSPDSPRYAYARALYDIVPKDQQPMRASATERAEAFGRTLNLW